MELSAGDTENFSIDMVHIGNTSQSVAPAVVFVGGGNQAVSAVQAAFAPKLARLGINLAQVQFFSNTEEQSVAGYIDSITDLNRPVVLVGLSWGGYTALQAAEAATRKVNDVILLDPAVNGSVPVNPLSNIYSAVDISRTLPTWDKVNGFTITAVTGDYINSSFPGKEADHAVGELTPYVAASATPNHAAGFVEASDFAPGDPDTSEYLEDAADGFLMFWGKGIKV
jgi:pimeloyl-ACP methyl ester carboxylesterase